MPYTESKRVAVFSNIKEAALYFDYVVPLENSLAIEVLKSGDERAKTCVFAPELFISESSSQFTPAASGYYTHLARISSKYHNRTTDEQGNKIAIWHLCTEGERADSLRLLNDLLKSTGTFIRQQWSDTDRCPEDNSGAPCIAVSGMNLVDTDKLSWKHLIDFKNDTDSVAQLRRLRIFLATEYPGKEIGFIKDDLINRIEEYNQAISKWGFATRSSAFEIIFDSKDKLSEIASYGAAALIVGPNSLPAAAALTIGASASIGKLLLRVSRRRNELLTLKQNNPITFLAEATRQASFQDGD